MQNIEADMLRSAQASSFALGVKGLRPLQEEVLLRLARGKCTFAALPTGYGKSLCYLLPAVAWKWRVWVISPLISLIEDQTLACTAMGISSIGWIGGSPNERRALERKMKSGDWQICFLSPERYVSWAKNGYLKALSGMGLSADLLVVDEMHCMPDWKKFRSGYSEVAPLIRREVLIGGALLLGLSASLPEIQAREWMSELCEEHEFVGSGLGRDNLSLAVVPLEREQERWLLVISALRGLKAPESALVYCHSREESENLGRWLQSAGIPAVTFHAGLPHGVRRARARAFREGHLRVVCATVAFGMGIDYPHVSRVIHFSLPRDLESYWQEVGRAGRGSGEAHAIAFWRRSEIGRARRLPSHEKRKFLELWQAWSGGQCRKLVVAKCLGIVGTACGKCDRCAGMNAHPLLGPPLHNPWWVSDFSQLENWIEERFGMHED